MSKKIIRWAGLVAIAALAFVGLFKTQNTFAASADPWWVQNAIDDSEEEACTRKLSGFGWFQCGMNRYLSSVSLNIVYDIAESMLKTDPGIFENDAVIEGWKTVRNVANLVVLGMLIVVILSQISGVGVSNYGVKKALPRIVVVVVLVNLSFVICRIAVDVMNLSAEAIENTFSTLTSTARANITFSLGSSTIGSAFSALFGNGANSVLTVALAFFGTKSFLASGESIVMLGLFVLVAILVGILFFFATITVRSALVVLLTVTAPAAIILAVFPGTKKTFNKWFDLFKGVLICYPMAALMFYGGDFAATIAMAALGVNGITIGVGSTAVHLPVNVFTVMVSAAASIAPMFLLPGLVVKSMGAIGVAMQNVARALTNGVTGLLGTTDTAKLLQRKEADMRNRIRAGVDKDGKEKTGRLARFMRAGSAEDRMEAQKALAANRARRRAEDLGVDAEDQDSKSQFEYYENEKDIGTDDASIAAEIDDILSKAASGGEAECRLAASHIDGLMKHLDKKTKGKHSGDALLQKALEGGGVPNALRAAVASKRLSAGGARMKGKSPTDYVCYELMANAGEKNLPWTDEKGKQRAIAARLLSGGDISFNSIALSSSAKSTIGTFADMLDDPNTDKAIKEQIVRMYEEMPQTSAYYQETAQGDFDEDVGGAKVSLREAVDKYKRRNGGNP